LLVLLLAPPAADAADPPARPPLEYGRAAIARTDGTTGARNRRDPVATGSLAYPVPKGDDPLAILKTLVATGRYASLIDRWPEVAPALRIPWARKLLLEGGTTAVATPLVRDLWLMGFGDGAVADPKTEALRVLFYTYLRIRIDGERCSDQSAPGDLLRDLRVEFRPVFTFAETLPQGVVRNIAFAAIAQEQLSAPHRAADPFVCSRGRLGLRTGQYLDPALVDGLMARTRDAAAQDLLAFIRR
jgi:hypothetical protein